MSRYKKYEAEVILAAIDVAAYGCSYPIDSPAYRAHLYLREVLAKQKKILRKSGELRPGERFKYWVRSNTEWNLS